MQTTLSPYTHKHKRRVSGIRMLDWIGYLTRNLKSVGLRPTMDDHHWFFIQCVFQQPRIQGYSFWKLWFKSCSQYRLGKFPMIFSDNKYNPINNTLTYQVFRSNRNRYFPSLLNWIGITLNQTFVYHFVKISVICLRVVFVPNEIWQASLRPISYSILISVCLTT